jgi:hypothetical protein
MNSRESPFGEVANKGRLKPVATIWVCNCARAGGIQTVAAKAAASKMAKNLFMIAPWSQLYQAIEITKVGVLYLYRQCSAGCQMGASHGCCFFALPSPAVYLTD